VARRERSHLALSQLADPSRDVTGLAIASENLPERVHLRRPRRKQT